MKKILLNQLKRAICAIDNPDEAGRFLRDLLTLEEMTEFVNRLETARLLNKEYTYDQIEEQAGVSSATIARVNFWLQHGKGGYKEVLKKIE